MADTPFGLSFGNPSKYMGQSPLAEAGKALKTGAVLWGLQQSGAINALDKMGVKPTQGGGFQFNNSPIGSVSPTGSVPPVGVANQPINPNIPDYMAPVDPEAVATSTPVNMYTPPPPKIGLDILDGNYHGSEQSSVNPQAQRDFNPFVPQTGYNQMLATGNEYQQVPGYGRAKQIASMMTGMG